ncbi:SDR family NAD(P)-dependent oxidoreductase [Saccharopolyspora sp. SCSIO 74807]|uniref:SDR family NAD(P)-dependent oxidoreductase n=1 Tax=Saccharopolyspora sp. SCSIO 74807 TaxID=3118084 RepID=UPI0030CD61AB
MTERPTILLTGATDGLGHALAQRLAAEGARLLLHGRDPDKLASVAEQLHREHGERPHTAVADMAELAQVRELAQTVRGATDRLDVLISNAGIGASGPGGRERTTSVDGHELRFAVNYLAGFLLTLELLPLLRETGRAGGRPSRVVNVASAGQQALDFDDLMLRHDYRGGRAYCQSKLAQIMSGFTLAELLPADEVVVNSLHPATYMPTKIVTAERIDSIEDGVRATRRLAVDGELAGVTGRYFDRTSESRAHEQAYDPRARAALWERSLELTGHPGS